MRNTCREFHCLPLRCLSRTVRIARRGRKSYAILKRDRCLMQQQIIEIIRERERETRLYEIWFSFLCFFLYLQNNGSLGLFFFLIFFTSLSLFGAQICSIISYRLIIRRLKTKLYYAFCKSSTREFIFRPRAFARPCNRITIKIGFNSK